MSASTEPESKGDENEGVEVTRRQVLGAAAATAAVGAAGHFSGRAAAASSSDDLGTESNPFVGVHTGKFRLLGTTSTPSSPTDYATLHYRSDLD